MGTIEKEFLDLLRKIMQEDAEIDDLYTLDRINSLNFIKLVVEIEQHFGIQFDDSDLDYGKFPTGSSIIEYIEGKLNLVG